MINRFSSIQSRKEGKSLGQSFLNDRLKNAVRYDRIAGYFSPSILQIAGESIEAIGKTRMVCNSQIVLGPSLEGKSVLDQPLSRLLWSEWRQFGPAEAGVPGSQLERLYALLDSKRLTVRILPDDSFGLIHGKAGVITMRDGSQTSFMGSANESIGGWQINYEIVWEDDSPEAIAWVQSEFEALWNHSRATDLSREIILDIQRTARRTIVGRNKWKDTPEPEPAAALVESPVYEQQSGVWAHQKYFVVRAFQDHLHRGGARYILADQVGLGKTLQLAMAAQMMALHGEFPVLVIAPRTLLEQWQQEFLTLLGAPSAYWNGLCWVDENGVEHAKLGHRGLLRCPRKIGIVSQGLIQRSGEGAKALARQKYECVIVDEAHRARRRKIPSTGDLDVTRAKEGNNLFSFLQKLSSSTKSLLLATATPVQLHPVEGWDLLSLLALGSPHVLGDDYSPWQDPASALKAVIDGHSFEDIRDAWQWIRNPLPPEYETSPDGSTPGRPFEALRDRLDLKASDAVAGPNSFDKLSTLDRDILDELRGTFTRNHSPFLRHIIRRTRQYLETQSDKETGKPVLQPVTVVLFGEEDAEALDLNAYLQGAYSAAQEYCRQLSLQKRGSGFLETLLLRRIGSSMYAGSRTATKLLHGDDPDSDQEEDEGPEGEGELNQAGTPALGKEAELLNQIIENLKANEATDPKLQKIHEILMNGVSGGKTEPWIERGCILFSSYYDTAYWIASSLSEKIKDKPVGLYTSSDRSGILQNGEFVRYDREELKQKVKSGKLKLIVGTEAASEGLNLQTLGSLINIDLPWNPTRLEQRKGRIQRIGQLFPEVYVYNLRYKDSVEDRVHTALSERLEAIQQLFGQIPDTLSDAWIQMALDQKEEAKKTIEGAQQHPFELKYNQDYFIPGLAWEHCAQVLNKAERVDFLRQGWQQK